jgi:hypothetical protein
MDRFAKMVVVLGLSLFRQVGLFLKLLTDWIMIVLTTKPNMRLFYLGWRFCMHGSETCGSIWRFFIGGAASFQGMSMFKWFFKCLS